MRSGFPTMQSTQAGETPRPDFPLLPLVLRGFRLFGNRLPAQRQPQALALHAQAWERAGRCPERAEGVRAFNVFRLKMVPALRY